MTNPTDSNVPGSSCCHPNSTGMYALCVIVGLIVGAGAAILIKGGRITSSRGSVDEVVAEVSGKKVHAKDVFESVKNDLLPLEEQMYEAKSRVLNEYINRILVENEAKRQNVAPEVLMQRESAGPIEDVSNKEVDDFLKERNLDLKTAKNIKREDVANFLKHRKNEKKRLDYINKLRQTASVKVNLKGPEMPTVNPTADGFPMWGNPKAPVTIFEFSDFQCPYCARVVPTIERIKEEFGPDKVRIVFRDMPLDFHQRAKPASLAAHCANEQGKFWEYHNMLFQNQTGLEDKNLKEYAKRLSLDTKKFSECYDSKKHDSTIEKSTREAMSMGIRATPSFVINGKLLQGAQGYEAFKEKIERALKGES